MKSIGMVRKIDELGRIVLPIETRRLMDISAGDGVLIFAEGDRLILQKYAPSCIFCGESENIVDFKDKKICKECLDSLKEI